jgi:hypothetical protein
MNRGWHRNPLHAGVHELQHGHLGSRVLHGNSVGPQAHSTLAPFWDWLIALDTREVTDQDLLGESERASQALPTPWNPLLETVVGFSNQIQHFNLHPLNQ